MIQIKNLTMDYGAGKGVFDIDIDVAEGEAAGFLGPNGAGKTTAIRCLLGFLRGQKGGCFIDGKESFANAPANFLNIGFIAGEPAFPDNMTGIEYLRFMLKARKTKSDAGMNELLEYFEFDAKSKIKRMSKGMKQKTAVVAAFMHDPRVYILDEPTSGLDLLMQKKFIDLLLAEKKRGKTILISSHMFEEVERTCDNIIIIREGRIIAKDRVSALKMNRRKTYVVESPQIERLKGFEITRVSPDTAEVSVTGGEIDALIKELGKITVSSLTVKEITLEEVFLKYYNKGGAAE